MYALLTSASFPDDALALPDGEALSPARAADCTRDIARTAAFVRGLHEAISTFDGEVDVLYAGTGPLAPLALPLMAMHENVRFTLVDVHPHSIEHLRALIDRFGFTRFVREIAVADATRFEPRVRPHIAVTETMRRSLEAEPQVAVTRQLARVLRPEGILVPERITLDLQVADPASAMAWLRGGALPPMRHVARLFELTRDTQQCEPVRVTIPGGLALLTTAIDVFRGRTVHGSGLTTPEILWDVRAGEVVEFRYVEGASPRLARRRMW